ncbi:YeeE/YedE family protein [Methylocapsa sp. S129]|uniref:YeeE/YedE family protein n=1 Tax=Methylocapsa sp. S129 TaxID=1641869 RepID=UPI00131CD5F2|nr:YeeE/YedE family protein [Methylocapsa sp. S129]
MTLDWAHFTPWSSLGGGLLIGLAASILILGAGRIMGAAGIVGGVVDPRPGDVGWRLWLIAGLLLAPTALALFSAAKAPLIEASWPVLIIAGLLVGFGTRLGSGCTSGHGVCGVSRLSPRSITATGLFMLTGFATVFLVRHVLS